MKKILALVLSSNLLWLGCRTTSSSQTLADESGAPAASQKKYQEMLLQELKKLPADKKQEIKDSFEASLKRIKAAFTGSGPAGLDRDALKARLVADSLTIYNSEKWRSYKESATPQQAAQFLLDYSAMRAIIEAVPELGITKGDIYEELFGRHGKYKAEITSEQFLDPQLALILGAGIAMGAAVDLIWFAAAAEDSTSAFGYPALDGAVSGYIGACGFVFGFMSGSLVATLGVGVWNGLHPDRPVSRTESPQFMVD